MLIRTQRLVLRDYAPSDWQDLHEIFSDPEVMKYCEPVYTQVRTKDTLAYFIQKNIACAVTLANSGKVIGHMLFHQLPGEETGIFEIGWFFNRSYWRLGYAFEAASALIQWGFQDLRLHKITAETIDAVKSVGLMKKLGMVHEGTFRAHTKDPEDNWADVHWYAILEPKEEL